MTDEEFVDALRIKTPHGNYAKLTSRQKRRLLDLLSKDLEEKGVKVVDSAIRGKTAEAVMYEEASHFPKPEYKMRGLLDRIENKATVTPELTKEKLLEVANKIFKGMNRPNPPTRHLSGISARIAHQSMGDKAFKEFLSTHQIIADIGAAKYIEHFIEKHKAPDDESTEA